MKHLLSATALLLCTAPGWCAEAAPAPPNTLSPREVSDGWLLLFDGETPFGWRIEGDAAVAGGALAVGGAKRATATPTTEFADYEMRLEFRTEGANPPQVFVQSGGDGEGRMLYTPPGAWASATIRSLRGSLSGEMRLPGGRVVSDGGDFPTPGRVTLTFEVPAGSKLHLRNVKLRPLALQPIFNGKDLAGWQEIAGKPSRFSVTEKGELSVKGGPGELQTERQWDDFVLQLDIIASGRHLNSGVFFRALPGEFWAGYESQIRNQWQGDDRAQPQDFGTGGIYGRQPARKVVSNDNEWFTKTVVAHGSHVAVWVNGYQVSDFTDARPLSEDARAGCKLGKGAIGLQGHDPATDLSFRNLRLAPLPK